MMLRESVQHKKADPDFQAITGDGDAEATGVDHAALLIEFAESVVAADDARLASARGSLQAAVGPAGVVDAAGVAAFFNGIDRVADSTGTQMDARWAGKTAEMRDELGISAFAETKKRLEADLA